MIERRTTTAPPPRYQGRVAIAFDYAHGLITEDRTVRTLVKGNERVAVRIKPEDLLDRAPALPWLYFTIRSGSTAVLSSGSEGTPRTGGPLMIEIAAVVAGSDPDHSIRIWDAIADAIGRDYLATHRLRAMWDAGVSAIQAGSYPIELESGSGSTEPRSAALGAVIITL